MMAIIYGLIVFGLLTSVSFAIDDPDSAAGGRKRYKQLSAKYTASGDGDAADLTEVGHPSPVNHLSAGTSPPGTEKIHFPPGLYTQDDAERILGGLIKRDDSYGSVITVTELSKFLRKVYATGANAQLNEIANTLDGMKTAREQTEHIDTLRRDLHSKSKKRGRASGK